MKRILVLFVIILAFASCSKLLTFNFGLNTSFTIPSTVLVDVPLNLPTPDIETNSTQTFDDNGTKSKYVKEIRLTQLDLTITSPQNQTFSFLKHVHIYINADGLEERLIAFYENVPPTVGNELSMEVTGADLGDYIKHDEFSLRTKVITDETILSNVEVDTDMRFQVEAKNPICAN